MKTLTLVVLTSAMALTDLSALQAPNLSAAYGPVPEVRIISKELKGGAEVQDITFTGLDGQPIEAYLVKPARSRPQGGVLFVHWYGPEFPTSNRTQFLPHAIDLAGKAVVSLLPATMWSEPRWFPRRKREDDLPNSVVQLKNLRRALDVLMAQPGLDPKRVGFVGHDFGAMFGAVLASVDRRPAAYVLIAGTPEFANWYLYGPKMAEPQRTEFVNSLKVIDPAAHVGKAAPAPVLFQFATNDEHVPRARAEQFFAAANNPKEIKWYEARHEMNDESRRDMVEWISRQLKLSRTPPAPNRR